MKVLWCEKCAGRLQVINQGGQEILTCPRCLGKVNVPAGEQRIQPIHAEITAKFPTESADRPTCPGCEAPIENEWRSCPYCRALLRVDYSNEKRDTLTGHGLDEQVACDRKTGMIVLWVLAALLMVFMIISCSGGSGGGIIDTSGLFPGMAVGGMIFLILFGAGLLKMEKSSQRGFAVAAGVFLFFVLAVCSGVIFGFVTCVVVTTRVF